MSNPTQSVQPRNTTHAIRLLRIGESLTLEGRGRSLASMASKLVHAKFHRSGGTLTRTA
jgi:carbon monoxide dehydrogenase subunit G